MYLFKDSQHCHRIHSSDQAAEQEIVEQWHILQAKGFHLADPIQGEANPKHIPYCPHDRVKEDCTNVLKKGTAGHEVTCVKDDGWQEVQEKDVAVHNRWWLVI